MKTIVFDVWGDWAHFKKFYTTASPITFHFPPITAVKGLVGAILGLGKEKSDDNFYIRVLDGLMCAVQIKCPIKTFRMGYNWIETKKAKFLSRIPSEKGRYQTVIETVKDPYYRIYLAFPEKESMLTELAGLLRKHKSIYTPYLGISEHLANFRFITETEAQRKQGKTFIPIHTVVSIDHLQGNGELAIQIQEGHAYQRDRIPVAMNAERMVTRYESVIYEMNGKPVFVIPREYWELPDGTNISFFQ